MILKKNYLKVINFFNSNKGKQITGKLISSKWDNIETWNNKIKKLINNDFYNFEKSQKIIKKIKINIGLK